MNFANASFQEFWNYWKSCATGSGIPTNASFDLLAIPTLLPDLSIWSYAKDGRIICRMTGTRVVQRMNTDITGAYLGDLMPAGYEGVIAENFRTLLNQPCGLYLRSRNHHPSGKQVRMEALTLPLAATEKVEAKFVSINHMLEVVGFDEANTPHVALGQRFEARDYVDLGWGLPKNPA